MLRNYDTIESVKEIVPGMKNRKKITALSLVFALIVSIVSIACSKPVVAEAATKKAEAAPSVLYCTQVQNVGWQDYVKDGALSGTEGRGLRLESIKIKLNSTIPGSIKYRVHVQSIGWQNYVKNDAVSGTVGMGLRLEAIEIKLTGKIAEQYDVFYRVHCQSYGWLNWVKNGALSGTEGEGKRLESIQIKLVKKTGAKKASVKYRTHVQSDGWQDYVYDGAMSGTEGRSLRLEGIYIDLDTDYLGGIMYKTHVQSYGWQDYVTSNNFSGTSGQSKRLEAISIQLFGEVAKHYDVYYRVHAQSFGWLDWAKNGGLSGTAGFSKRLEGIEIKLVKKGGEAPGATKRPFVDQSVLDAEEKARQEEERKKQEEEEANLKKLPLMKKINAVQLHPMLTNDPVLDARVQQIIAEATTEKMTTYQKVKALYKWIMKHSVYAYDDVTASWNNTSVNYASIEDKKLVSQAYPILFEGYGTCINYASAFVVLSRAIGLESYRVEGGQGGGDHYWAMVVIGSERFFVDPQIEDSMWSGTGTTPLNFFFVKTKVLQENGFWYAKSAFKDAIKRFNNFKVN